MADPLGPAGAGISPFLTSKGTVDTALSLLRDLRRRQGAPGNLGAPGAGTDPLGPSVRVLVRNDTSAALSVFDVVKLGDPVQTISDDASAVLFSAMPAFKGTAPSATTDQFGILEEPIAYPGGGRYAFGRAVVQGVVPVKIQVSDSGHGYATPSGSYTDRLASASTGPARILWKESGTGEKWAVVNLDVTGDSSLSVVDYTAPSAFNITSDDTWTNNGGAITLPTAGTYLVTGKVSAEGQVSSGSSSLTYTRIAARLYDVTAGAEVASGTQATRVTVLQICENNVLVFGTAPIMSVVAITSSTDIRIEALRTATPGAPTWVSATIKQGTHDKTGLHAIKLF